MKMMHVLANRIGRALIPIVTLVRLLRGENVDEATRIWIKFVGLLNVTMKRSSIKLLEDKDLIKTRVKAVTDRDIDQTVLTSERYRRITAVPGQRTEARAATSAHYNTDDFSFFHMSVVLSL